MKKLLSLLAFTLLAQILIAQKISISGTLVDSTANALPSATVLLLNAADSSLVNFTATNSDGTFIVKNVNRQPYLLKITFVGYETLNKTINPSQAEITDVGKLVMKPETRQLNEVTINAERAPVTIKKDTIEFNAGSFKTKENALVEDLLKKLPGVEVDNDGTIRANGEQVKRVMVDGKNFFGTDPKLATRNLLANAIDKVQVFDKKSDQAVFSGIDDGQREKTINLELKEERRKGAFGNAMAGGGSDERFQTKLNINKFRKTQQFSVLGMANNINEQGFGIDEYMNFSGGSQQMMRGGAVRLEFNSNNQNSVPINFGGRNTGLMTNYAGGANFNKEINKKTELTSSYFYNHLDHDTKQTLDRLNYYPGGDVTFNQKSRQLNTNDNHKINVTLEHKIDSANSLKWSNSVSYNQTSSNTTSSSVTNSQSGMTINESDRNTIADGDALSLSSNLLWRHRFSKKGRTLSANVQYSLNNSDRDGSLMAVNKYYLPKDSVQELNQQNTQRTNNTTYSAGFSYTEPVGKRKYLEFNYNFRENANDVDKKVYDVSNAEEMLNTSLSNQYESDYQYHRSGVNFRIVRSKYNVVVGTALQQTSLFGELKTLNAIIRKNYQNMLPVARINYDFTSTQRLSLDYETSVQEPTIQQLQPVVDNSDPLNLTVGNTSLRPAYMHNWRFNFSTFNPVSFVNFFAFVDANITKHAIATSQQFTAEQVRISKPVNVDQNVRVNGNATVGFPIKKLNSRFNIGANTTYQAGKNIINDVESDIAQQSIGSRLGYEYRYKEIIFFNTSANLSRVSTQYQFNEQADQLYYNNTYTTEANITFLKNYQFNSALEYLVYSSKTLKYKQEIPLLNLAISRFILKARSGELKFSVNNVLDKNIGVSQTADINYFERQVSNSLGRYYMISFTYALNKQLNPLGFRRGGMMRIMRN